MRQNAFLLTREEKIFQTKSPLKVHTRNQQINLPKFMYMGRISTRVVPKSLKFQILDIYHAFVFVKV